MCAAQVSKPAKDCFFNLENLYLLFRQMDHTQNIPWVFSVSILQLWNKQMRKWVPEGSRETSVRLV